MVDRQDPSALRWLVGVELRNFRVRAGETSAAAARAIGCSPGKITHLETGRYFPQPDEVAGLLKFYGVPDWEVERLNSLAGRSNQRTWWAPWVDVLPDWLKTYVGLEGIAESLFAYQALIVPGLMQTEAYAAALTMTSARVRPDHNERLVSFRMARQRRLVDETPVRLKVVVEESVLDRPIGDREVMREQLQRLLDLSMQDNIDLRVLSTSAGPHAGLNGSFMVLHFPDAQPIGYVEIPDGAVYIQDQDQVAAYVGSAERLTSSALSEEASAEAIRTRLAE